MKNTNKLYNLNSNESNLISRLYDICSNEELQLTNDKTSMTMPVIEENPELVRYYDAVPHAVLPFDPATDTYNLEAFGLYVPMDNIQMHMPLVVINSKNIELCARQYVQSHFAIPSEHPSFHALLLRTIRHMKAIAKVYFTSLWVLEHAIIDGRASYGVPTERTFENSTFKKSVALWMTFNVVKDQVGINSVMQNIIKKNKCFPSLLKTLMNDTSAGFQALKQCIIWDTYSVDLLRLLCEEHSKKDGSNYLLNPFEFWYPLTIVRYDKRTSHYMSAEIKRIITMFYPNYLKQLPFLFDGSDLHRWN